MSKHIGIVACSAEGAALCYRTLCSEAPALMGEHMHPEVSMHTHPLAQYMVHIRSGNWSEVAKLMLSSSRKLASIGAQFAICPDNTIHQAFDLVTAHSPIPWIHIAEAVAQEARTRELKTLAITGTKYLMTGPVYPDTLRVRARITSHFDIPSSPHLLPWAGLAKSKERESRAKAMKTQGCNLRSSRREAAAEFRAESRPSTGQDAHILLWRAIRRLSDLRCSVMAAVSADTADSTERVPP